MRIYTFPYLTQFLHGGVNKLFLFTRRHGNKIYVPTADANLKCSILLGMFLGIDQSIVIKHIKLDSVAALCKVSFDQGNQCLQTLFSFDSTGMQENIQYGAVGW